jgi:hypothetical protein
MNPSVPQSTIDAAYERDPASAEAEYGAQFRSDIEAYINREAVEAAVTPGLFGQMTAMASWIASGRSGRPSTPPAPCPSWRNV